MFLLLLRISRRMADIYERSNELALDIDELYCFQADSESLNFVELRKIKVGEREDPINQENTKKKQWTIP